jgi:hypothetical protein
MLNRNALDALRLQLCAVGSLEVPLEEYKQNPLAPTFRIEGTGFLIAPSVVLTNRHVITAINAHLEKHGLPRDRRQVSFLHPDGEGFRSILRPFIKAVIVTRPNLLDFGLIQVDSPPGDLIHRLGGARVSEAWTYASGDPIAMVGYPGGTDLLRSPERDLVYRMGPLLQQGYVSAIAPWDHAPMVDRLLLDVRSAGGFSGAPVLHSESGDVIGIHNAAAGSVVAFALPLDGTVVASLLAALNAAGDGETPARIEGVRRPK